VQWFDKDHPHWRFEQTGQPNDSYYIKDTGSSDNSLVVVPGWGDELKLGKIDWSNGDQ
jgi:hypothetical protein